MKNIKYPCHRRKGKHFGDQLKTFFTIEDTLLMNNNVNLMAHIAWEAWEQMEHMPQ